MAQAVKQLSSAGDEGSRRRARVRLFSWGTSYAMLAPFLILFIVFIVWPILCSGYLSLTKYGGKTAEFIGFDNYVALFKDKRFLKAMTNIFQYVAGIVSLNTVLGLALALVFRAKSRLNQFVRTAFFLPAVTSSIASGLIFRWIFTGEEYGLANTIRGWLGLEAISWLATPALAIPILLGLGVWGGVGMTMIIFLAGLQGISRELYEAAALDGASPWQRFWRVTLPLLRPTFLYLIITGMISAFQLFDASYVIFQSVQTVGGVLDSALTPVLYLYYQGFKLLKLGYASSIAWILFTIIIVLTLINLRLGRANEAD